MKERPILMNGPMVRAVLAGTKTQTRRIVKPQPRLTMGKPSVENGMLVWRGADGFRYGHAPQRCPYGQPGDRLWVRETWNKFPPWEGYFYAADDHSFGISECDDSDHIEPQDLRWKPSIHMPREASRLTLEITEVRVERLNEIRDGDARAEGARSADYVTGRECILDPSLGSYRLHFRDLWESINGSGSWAANPWVWVVSFRRLP